MLCDITHTLSCSTDIYNTICACSVVQNLCAELKKMNKIELCYDGKYFNVMVDDETYSELINDQNKLSTYAEQVYNMISEESNKESNINLPGPSTFNTDSTTDENFPELIKGPSTSIGITGTAFKWTQSLTLMLIDLRLIKEKDFNRPIRKKKKLWAQIATEIKNETGKLVNGEMCDIKYRNLLSTNEKKSQQSGEGCISWEFYQKFDEVLGCKAAILPHREVLGDVDSVSEALTANETDVTESETEENGLNRGRPSPVKNITNKVRNKKCKQSIDIGEYLFHKQIEDKEKRLEKEKRKDERWREKRALKEREIEAIEKLAEAISKQKKN